LPVSKGICNCPWLIGRALGLSCGSRSGRNVCCNKGALTSCASGAAVNALVPECTGRLWASCGIAMPAV
jgi:hypothetical protein